MSDIVPRLRMFAGPNGSGKSTVKNDLDKSTKWFGVYINPDELELTIQKTNMLYLNPFGLALTSEEIHSYFASSQFLQAHGLTTNVETIRVQNDAIDFSGLSRFTSYHASVLADLLRRKCLDARQSFTFETVMSASDKVDLLKEAQARGFRTYLYFMATGDPAWPKVVITCPKQKSSIDIIGRLIYWAKPYGIPIVRICSIPVMKSPGTLRKSPMAEKSR